MIFKSGEGLVLSLLLIAIIFTGCTGDSAVEELTEGVEGPSQVIVNEESDQFTATGPTGANYAWGVGDGLGTFTAPSNSKTKFVASNEALNQGTIDISVFIDSTEKKVEDIEVLSHDSETEYAKGTFHSIAATADMKRKGYVAVGTVGSIDLSAYKNPYMVKSDNRGIVIDEKSFSRDGRFYEVQDFVRTGLGDYYYLIGYGKGTNDVYEAFVLEVDKKMEIKKEYNSNEITTGDAYLRSGIIVKSLFSSDHLVAVGNKEVDNENYAPYIIDINTNQADDFDHHVLDSTYGYSFSNPYYNLESIVETNDGYIAVGYTNPTNNSRSGATGIILTLNSEFNVIDVKTSITEKLYKIKKVDTGSFIVVGEQGYIAELDSNLIANEYSVGAATYRDIIIDGDNYVLVGADNNQGVIAKIAAQNLSGSPIFEKNYGTYLYGVDKTTDGDYVAAGHSTSSDSTNNCYIVKVNSSDGNVVARVK